MLDESQGKKIDDLFNDLRKRGSAVERQKFIEEVGIGLGQSPEGFRVLQQLRNVHTKITRREQESRGA